AGAGAHLFGERSASGLEASAFLCTVSGAPAESKRRVGRSRFRSLFLVGPGFDSAPQAPLRSTVGWGGAGLRLRSASSAALNRRLGGGRSVRCAELRCAQPSAGAGAHLFGERRASGVEASAGAGATVSGLAEVFGGLTDLPVAVGEGSLE